MLERAILTELNWDIEGANVGKCLLQLFDILSPLITTKNAMIRCFRLCDYLILHPRFFEFGLDDILLNVLYCVTDVPRIVKNKDLICKVWVESNFHCVESLINGDVIDLDYTHEYNQCYFDLFCSSL
jgi:hypothetical protein